jgi:hypothetical protein
MSYSTLFWNRPPKKNTIRPADPLGFDALREAMADALVPLLTGATRDADEYIWTVVGLRWARKETKSSIDATIYNKGFALFERALKQYLCRFCGWKGSGINVVKELCKGPKPNVGRPILLNERSTGLLGSYIVSLRGMGLVQKNSLHVVEDASERLLADMHFSARNWTSSWNNLEDAFSNNRIDFTEARQRLGGRLFSGEDQSMRRSASAIRKQPKAVSWVQVAQHLSDKEQFRIAKATKAVIQLEKVALEAFGNVLHGEKTLSVSLQKKLCYLAVAAQKADPFPSSWAKRSPLREAISIALSSLAGDSNSNPAAALLRLHKSVTHDIRKNEPWISDLGDIPAVFEKWKPSGGTPDFRFGNLRKLVVQTKWRPRET